jgi:hypothetical protein
MEPGQAGVQWTGAINGRAGGSNVSARLAKRVVHGKWAVVFALAWQISKRSCTRLRNPGAPRRGDAPAAKVREGLTCRGPPSLLEKDVTGYVGPRSQTLAQLKRRFVFE